jgi:hypothetical protein
MTLKVRSKADFKSKSQNIWQQIILFSSTVMQMIYRHKIWTLSGKLSFMHNVQLMKIYIYIPCVPHKNNCKEKMCSHDMKHRFLNNHCQECVCAYLSIHDCLSFLHEVMIGNHRTKTFLHEVMIGNHRNKLS